MPHQVWAVPEADGWYKVFERLLDPSTHVVSDAVAIVLLFTNISMYPGGG